MENSKHTAGEWQVSKHGNDYSFGVYADGMRNDLAIVTGSGGNEPWGEAAANAAAISAVPEMLEALNYVAAWGKTPPTKELWNEMLIKANAAIAKATN